MVGVTIGTVRIQGGASAGVCFRGVPNFGGDSTPFLVLATLLRAHRSENVSRLRWIVWYRIDLGRWKVPGYLLACFHPNCPTSCPKWFG